MRLVDEEPETLDAIIITHEHSDHVGGRGRDRAQAGHSGLLHRGNAPRLDALAFAAQADDLCAVDGAECASRPPSVRRRRAEDEGEADESDLVERSYFARKANRRSFDVADARCTR